MVSLTFKNCRTMGCGWVGSNFGLSSFGSCLNFGRVGQVRISLICKKIGGVRFGSGQIGWILPVEWDLLLLAWHWAGWIIFRSDPFDFGELSVVDSGQVSGHPILDHVRVSSRLELGQIVWLSKNRIGSNKSFKLVRFGYF